MASVPIDPAKLAVRPALLDSHATHVANATEVSRTFAARHAGYVGECVAAWAGSSAEALAELGAHWETTDARLHGRISAFSAAMSEGGRLYMEMEEQHAHRFTVLVPRAPSAQ
ncbi:WXG100 family type VII secretion target [Mycolicibacter virginiensis]|uniref:WXG100 family type VII secretion target n=1 Tax=Mycolicibacter virginiensis TaxID=1795032 RepID=UPI001F040471|nr:hypothetical protein [Mycolicibacter virginiensis]ULP45914.1 hypothetical protein MJO54_13645 [Mycolicibacter virginiensis]